MNSKRINYNRVGYESIKALYMPHRPLDSKWNSAKNQNGRRIQDHYTNPTPKVRAFNLMSFVNSSKSKGLTTIVPQNSKNEIYTPDERRLFFGTNTKTYNSVLYNHMINLPDFLVVNTFIYLMILFY